MCHLLISLKVMSPISDHGVCLHSAAIIMYTVYYIKEIPTLINILAPQACSLVQDVDECFAKFNLQGFYKASRGNYMNVVLKS